MAKKKKTKKKAIRFLLFGITCIALVIIILVTLTDVWVDIYSKYKEKKQLEQNLLKLKEEEEELMIDVEKLQDPEYIARYLREKYFYSKDGEYIIKIPKGDTKE